MDKRGNVLSRGCSHTHDGGMKVRSVHAEHHALRRMPFKGDLCIIVTITANGTFAGLSKPCAACARLLYGRVASVAYCERDGESWVVHQVSPDELVDCKPAKYN